MSHSSRNDLEEEEATQRIPTVNVDLGQGIINSLLLISPSKSCFQKWKQELETISRLDLGDKLIDWH
jgi:hypothetical protein